jgi:hypothetical protein
MTRLEHLYADLAAAAAAVRDAHLALEAAVRGHARLLDEVARAQWRCGVGKIPDGQNQVFMSAVIDTVAAHFSVPVRDIIGPSRVERIAYARQVCMWLFRQMGLGTFAEIGEELGGRDSGTAIHGVKAVEERRDTYADFRVLTDRLLVECREALSPQSAIRNPQSEIAPAAA